MKYTGKLAKPIVRRRVGLLMTDEQLASIDRAEFAELFSKLPLLAEAHGVSHGDWFALAVSLARAHVPGFKFVEPAGRPVRWHALDKAHFKLDVDSFRATGKTLDASIRIVAKRDEWSAKVAGMKPAALRQHYYSADPRWVGLASDARAYKSMVGDD